MLLLFMQKMFVNIITKLLDLLIICYILSKLFSTLLLFFVFNQVLEKIIVDKMGAAVILCITYIPTLLILLCAEEKFNSTTIQ